MSVTNDEATIRALLSSARKAQKSGKIQEAEFTYQQALEIAEKMFGDKTAAVGLVLLDLIEFYQQQAYRHPAKLKLLTNRMRDILALYAHRDRLSRSSQSPS